MGILSQEIKEKARCSAVVRSDTSRRPDATLTRCASSLAYPGILVTTTARPLNIFWNRFLSMVISSTTFPLI